MRLDLPGAALVERDLEPGGAPPGARVVARRRVAEDTHLGGQRLHRALVGVGLGGVEHHALAPGVEHCASEGRRAPCRRYTFGTWWRGWSSACASAVVGDQQRPDVWKSSRPIGNTRAPGPSRLAGAGRPRVAQGRDHAARQWSIAYTGPSEHDAAAVEFDLVAARVDAGAELGDLPVPRGRGPSTMKASA